VFASPVLLGRKRCARDDRDSYPSGIIYFQHKF